MRDVANFHDCISLALHSHFTSIGKHRNLFQTSFSDTSKPQNMNIVIFSCISENKIMFKINYMKRIAC